VSVVSDVDVVDHPKIHDAHVQLRIDHAGEHLPHVVDGRRRARNGLVHGRARVVGIRPLHMFNLNT
jgi:hypothetical protein